MRGQCVTANPSIEVLGGGVTAARGFLANGIHAGIRKNKAKRDLALIYSEVPARTAAVYTRNKVKGAPLLQTKANLADGMAQAIICNSGNANTCNADGRDVALAMCRLTGDALGVPSERIVVASTGVIGQPLDISPIAAHLPALAAGLGDKSTLAAEAIMTTDTVVKEVAVRFELDGSVCTVGGIAKGSGMVHPDLATMLVFITTDASITNERLWHALSHDVQSSFNQISIDGDTSTNDMVVVMANGLAGNAEIDEDGPAFRLFMRALNSVTVQLCRLIASDGEGATRLVECRVSGAKDVVTARKAAKSVVASNLLKAAMYGADANWGRVLCAIGNSGADADVDRIEVGFASAAGRITVCRNGNGVMFNEDQAHAILSCPEVEIQVDLHAGTDTAMAWGCDLTYDYVRINGDYRS